MKAVKDLPRSRTDPGECTVVELKIPQTDLHGACFTGGVEVVPFEDNLRYLADKPLRIRRAGPLPKG